MKKIFLAILICLLLTPSLIFAAEPLLQCSTDPCSFKDFTGIIGRATNFITTYIITPLATLFLIIGGVVMLVSGGNPEMKSTGKKILTAAIIGLFLALCAKMIINFILQALGATGYSV